MRSAVVTSTFVAVLFVIGLILIPKPAAAETYYGGYTTTACINANSGVGLTPFNNAGPSGKTWTVDIALELSGGDTLQNFWTYWDLGDLANSNIVEWRTSGVNWEQTNTLIHGSPLTLNMQGNMKFLGGIQNTDSASQCYYVSANALYW